MRRSRSARSATPAASDDAAERHRDVHRGEDAMPEGPDGDTLELEAGGEPGDPEDVGGLAGSEEGEDDDALRRGDAAARLRLLRTHLGLAAPPVYVTIRLPLDHLVVPNVAWLGRRARAMSVNVGLVGMLHPPVVVPLPGTDTFRVVTGRGRVAGARLVGEPAELECHRYEQLSPIEERLLILSENVRRAPAWAQEIEALAELIAAGVGLTEGELAILFGLSVATVRERLRLARLPEPIVAQIAAGGIGQATAKRIVRLGTAPLAALTTVAEDGEEITDELVRRALRGQIGAGMAPMRRALDDTWAPWDRVTSWEEAGRTMGMPTAGPVAATGATIVRTDGGAAPAATEAADAQAWRSADLERFVGDLRMVERALLCLPGTARACLLVKALAQELGALRPTLTTGATGGPTEEIPG